jgi:hypothetical protein
MTNKCKLLDCTIRDGGYLNQWNFSFPFVFRLLRVLDEAGFNYAEVGFWNPKQAGRDWVHCDCELLRSLKADELSLELVLLMDFGSCTLEEIPDELIPLVGLIRIASHKKDLAKAVEFAAQLKARGFGVTINAMGITSYSQADLMELAAQARKAEPACDYFYMADSFGALIPSRTEQLFHYLATVTEIPLGFHPHNNLELAVANTLSALGAGAAIVDSSLLGIGRGGGNLRSEVIAAILGRSGDALVNPLPLLSYADATFDRIGRNLGLSYDLEQVISGMAACHPNYASNLMGTKRKALDEIYRVIESIPDADKGRYSEDLLDKHIASLPAKTATGLAPAILKNTGEERAILLCPGADEGNWRQDSDAPVFSVNHLPAGIALKGVIFGSIRRLWQFGDMAVEIPIYLASDDELLKSLPECSCLETAWMKEKLGLEPHNSGIRALLLLLEAGYTQVDVYGMTGFAKANLGEDAPEAEFREAMDREAIEELQALRAAYEPLGATIQLHNSSLESKGVAS